MLSGVAPSPRRLQPLLACFAIALLLQSAFGTIALGGLAAWSPLHRHVALEPVPAHGHAFERSTGAPNEARCGSPHTDQHGQPAHTISLICAPGADASTASVLTLLLSGELGLSTLPAGFESAVLTTGAREPSSHHDEPAAPPPRH